MREQIQSLRYYPTGCHGRSLGTDFYSRKIQFSVQNSVLLSNHSMSTSGSTEVTNYNVSVSCQNKKRFQYGKIIPGLYNESWTHRPMP